MAELQNDGGGLRFVLALVVRVRPGGPGGPGGEEAGGGPVIVSAGMEYLDRRDGEWWPIVRLPPTQIPGEMVRRLLHDQAAYLAGGNSGFAWRPGEGAAFAVQVGAAPGGAVVEIGLDLGPFLAEVGGAPPRRDAELALFRLQAPQASLVRFADGLTRELEELAG